MDSLFAGILQGLSQGMALSQEKKRQQELDKLAKQMTEMKMKELGQDVAAKEAFNSYLAQAIVNFPGQQGIGGPGEGAASGAQAGSPYPTFPLNGPQPVPAGGQSASGGAPGNRLLNILSSPEGLMLLGQAYPGLMPAVQMMLQTEKRPLEMENLQLRNQAARQGLASGQLNMQQTQQAMEAQARKDAAEQALAAGQFPQLPPGGSVSAGPYSYNAPLPQRQTETGPFGAKRETWVMPGGQPFGGPAQPAAPPMSYEAITPEQGSRPDFWTGVYQSMKSAGYEAPELVGQDAMKWRDAKGQRPPANAPKSWVAENYEPFKEPTREEQATQVKAKQAVASYELVRKSLLLPDGNIDMAKVSDLWNPASDIYIALRTEGGPIDNFATFAGYLNSGAEIPEREREMIKNIFFPNSWDAARAKVNPAAAQQMIQNKLKAAELFAQGSINLDMLPPEERQQMSGLMASWGAGGAPATGSKNREIPYDSIPK